MADELRFLCDEMLAGLGRWLRIAGYDTAIASGGRRDRDLVKQAHAEQRILLTRDRRVVEIRPANDRTVVLENDGIDACAKELGQRLSLNWTLDPISRCTLCNARHRLLVSLPSRIRALGSTVQVCPCCVEHLGHVDASMVERKSPWCPFASMAGVTLNLHFESGSRRIRDHCSAVQQPQDQRKDDTDDQRRDDREVKTKVFALDDDISGQTAAQRRSTPHRR